MTKKEQFKFLQYEVSNVGFIMALLSNFDWISDVCAKYYVRKTERKIAKYKLFLENRKKDNLK